MKKTSVFLVMLLSACSISDSQEYCPIIKTSRENIHQFITNINYDAFQITLSGYENYCLKESNNQHYTVITPIFKLRRLESSSDTAVDTKFYIKYPDIGNYTGERVYSQTLNIKPQEIETTIKGKSVKLRIPSPPYNNFPLEIGLSLSQYAKAKAKSMYDINYKYISDEEIEQFNNTIEEKVLSVLPDEKIIYCDKTQQPIVVKKNTNSCK